MAHTRQLPTMQWQGHQWYYDHRLNELRRIDNFHRFVPVDQAEDQMNSFELNVLAELILEAEGITTI